MIKGVDVASYQAEHFDTKGSAFAIIKATEGASYVNPKMLAQAAWAREKGLVVGFYHFLRDGDMKAQARYFVEHCNSRLGDILAADWEDPKVSNGEKDLFIKEVKRLRPTRHKVLLYCNRDYWLHRDTTSYAGDGLWIADPNHPAGSPAIKAPWIIHQYSSAGGIDRNVAAFKDVFAMRTWADPGAPKPSATLTIAERVASLEKRVTALEKG